MHTHTHTHSHTHTVALADLVRNTTRITRLDLTHCTFSKGSSHGMVAIARALGSNTSLTMLTLASNGACVCVSLCILSTFCQQLHTSAAASSFLLAMS